MLKENIVQGIGVSDGVSYANCLCIKKPAIDVHSNSNWISKNIALEKLDEAISKTQEQLEKIKVLSKERLGEEKSSIFDAHIQMANDHEMEIILTLVGNYDILIGRKRVLTARIIIPFKCCCLLILFMMTVMVNHTICTRF